MGNNMGCNNSRNDTDENENDEKKPVLSVSEKNALSNATKERRSNQRLLENMVHEEFDRDIDTVYHTKKTDILGSGLCGIVRICIHRQTKIKYALKTLDKKKVKDENLDKLKNEIRIMASLGHPNIVRLHECFENPDKIYLVMEVCTGGELLDRLHRQAEKRYTEKDACKLVHTMLGSIRYCHEHQIVHRDLKLENFLFESKLPDAELKLIDFGLSQHFKPAEVLSTPVGTPYYVAPEVLGGAYDAKCDVWAIGVIAYMLVSGSPPFYGTSDAETLRAVQEGVVLFNQKHFRGVNDSAKNFISECLTKNPLDRPSAEEALRHEWFKTLADNKEPVSLNIIDRLRGFEKKSALHRLCMEVVAHSMTTEQIRNLRKEFKTLDTEGSGEISYEALKQVMRNFSTITDEDVDLIFKNARSGWEHTGRINYHEFIAATISLSEINEENMKLAFEKMSNRNGFITFDDIHDLLGKDATNQDVEDMLLELGLSRDSHISYQQFENIMREGVVDPNCSSPVGLERRFSVRKGPIGVERRPGATPLPVDLPAIIRAHSQECDTSAIALAAAAAQSTNIVNFLTAPELRRNTPRSLVKDVERLAVASTSSTTSSTLSDTSSAVSRSPNSKLQLITSTAITTATARPPEYSSRATVSSPIMPSY